MKSAIQYILGIFFILLLVVITGRVAWAENPKETTFEPCYREGFAVCVMISNKYQDGSEHVRVLLCTADERCKTETLYDGDGKD